VPLTFDFLSAALVIVGGGVLVLILGLIGSWQALAARPAKELRARS
jgi:hypothetical protein